MTVKIYIDPGHGGHDSGAAANGLLEKNLTLDISRRIRAYLNANFSGHTVRLSRDSDVYLTLTQRTNAANVWNADYFLSVHINAGGGTGFESFIYNGGVSAKTRSAQDVIHAEIMREIGGTDRGKKSANFAVVRQSNMPAILTECLFIDRKADADKLKSSAFLDKLAKGHAEGIAKAFGLKRVAVIPITAKPKTEVANKEDESLKKEIDVLKKEMAALKLEVAKKQDKPSDKSTPSPSHIDAVEWAKEVGISNGERPHQFLTREQGMTMIKRDNERKK